MGALSREVLVTKVGFANLGASGAGGSSWVNGVNTASVDMANFNGVMFIAGLTHGGTSDARSFQVRQSSTEIAERSGSGTTAPDGTALTGALVTFSAAGGSSATSEAGVIDIYKPRLASGRFLFGTWITASSCAQPGQTYAIQYGPRQAGNTTAAGTIPQSTASALGLTGGVVYVTNAST
jgi:hypothetical protein